MELAARVPPESRRSVVPAELRSWLAPECEIGRRAFQGASDIVEAVEVAYQQKARTYGRLNPASGIMIHGDGLVAGGGGFVDTIHQSVATVIVRDCEGAENTLELPADVSARAKSILRIDSIDGRMIAVTNLSGKRDICRLASSTDFMAHVGFEWFDFLLAIFCVAGGAAGLKSLLASLPLGPTGIGPATFCLVAALVMGSVPMLKYRNIRITKRQRAELVDYMNAVTE